MQRADQKSNKAWRLKKVKASGLKDGQNFQLANRYTAVDYQVDKKDRKRNEITYTSNESGRTFTRSMKNLEVYVWPINC